MAQKRTAKVAFGAPNGQLSAAAAARQAKLLKDQPQNEETNDLVGDIAGVPYDGHHSGNVSDEEAQEEPVTTLKKSIPSIRLSTFQPDPENVLHDDEAYLEISLEAEQSATFVGEYDLQVLKGVVNIYGAMVHPDLGPQRVYALSTHALPAIVARNDSIIRITSISSGLLKLAKLSPLFRNIGSPKAAPKRRSFSFLPFNTSDPLKRPLQPLEIDEQTKRVLSRINALVDTKPYPRVMTTGPKSAGKSTFNRLLCNMIISRPGTEKLWYLDLDPGQPEFGPPGQISLIEIHAPILGPSYTHCGVTVIRTHTLAATTFKDDIEHYLACAADLNSTAISLSAAAPMVVNTCGWISGLGATAVLSLSSRLGAPDFILLGDSPQSEFARSLTGPVHHIPKRVRVQGIRTPAEQRAMATMAYFHKNCKNGWNAKPLRDVRPWLVGYGEEGGLSAILSYGQAPHPEFLAETLDGAIVAIVVTESSLVARDDVQRTADGLPYIPEATSQPLDPRKSHCVGLALVRGIDVPNKTLQLLTPVDIEKEVKGKEVVLVRGGFDSPDWAYLEDVHAGKTECGDDGRPWVQLTGEGTEHGKVWRVRRPPLAGGGK